MDHTIPRFVLIGYVISSSIDVLKMVTDTDLFLRAVFPKLEHLTITDLNPEAAAEHPEPHEVACTVKAIVQNLRRVLDSRSARDDRQLKSVKIVRSSIPLWWKSADISGRWALEGIEFDEACWETYYPIPFDEIETEDEYYADAFPS